MLPPEITCREIKPTDRDAVVNLLENAWGTVLAARKGELFDVSAYPGFVAEIGVPGGTSRLVHPRQ